MRSLTQPLRHLWKRIPSAAIARGAPPSWFGYRFVRRETVREYFARQGDARAGRFETVHAERVFENPLPRNMANRDDLPDESGWWGFSFRDVPERTGGETFIATIPDARVVWYRDPEWNDDFYPAVLSGDGTALELREMRFRPRHAEALRRARRPARLKTATWILERVYHNHSHWLTAHLPKLVLLQQRGALEDVLLPAESERTPAIDGSLRMLGIDPEAQATFDSSRPLEVEELTIIGTDRFRPELLQGVGRAFGVGEAGGARRRVFISRAGAARRRLVNEEQVWALLEPAGFERVRMETLTFERQVALMRETAVLVAPHGAGLTNMIFCPSGAQIVEIADMSFPNPNFYALASAMRHNYWLLAGEGLGEVHPLEKDLRIDPVAVERAVSELVR